MYKSGKIKAYARKTRLYVPSNYPWEQLIVEDHIEDDHRRLEVRIPAKRGSKFLIEYINPRFRDIVELVAEILKEAETTI